MKRYLAVLLSVLLVLGTVGSVSALELPLPTETFPATRDIMNFATNAPLRTAYGMKDLTDVAGEVIGGRITSSNEYPQWDRRVYFATADESLNLNVDQDMSMYRTFNVRMYSETATNATFKVILWHSTEWSEGYLVSDMLTVDWTGWKTISLDFDNMTREKTQIGSEKVGGVAFAFTGYGTTWVDGTDVSVAEIYLSNPVEGKLKLEDSKIVFQFDSEEKIQEVIAATWGGDKSAIAADTETTFLSGMTGMKVVPASGEWTMFAPCEGGTLNVTAGQYKYINVLMRSSQATEGSMNFLLTSSVGYFRKVLPIDWEGWKLVSIPLSEFGASADGTTWDAILNIRLNTGGWSLARPSGAQLNFDLIWFSKESPVGMTLKERVQPDGVADMPADGAELSFVYNNPIKRVDEAAFAAALTKDGETEGQPVTCTAEGSTLTLITQGTLDYETKYMLTIPAGSVMDIFGQSNSEAITHTFITHPQGMNVTVPVLTDGDGNPLTEMPAEGILKATAKASNATSEEKQVTLIIACYDDTNCMVACQINPVTIPANKTAAIETTIPAAGTRAKAFAIDNFFSMQPLQNGFAQIPPVTSGGTQGGAGQNAALKLEKADVTVNQLFIGGRVDGALPRMVIIAVNGELAEEPLFLTPVMANEDGTFSVETAMPESSDSGIYTVTAAARRIDGRQTTSFPYVSRTEQQTLCRTINAAETQAGVTQQLESSREMLGLPERGALLTHICTTVFEQKPYADYAALVSMLAESQSVLTELNAATWADYTKVLGSHPMILNSHADEAYYTSLNATGKGKVHQRIVDARPFASFADFRTAFAQAVADYKKEPGGGKTNNTSGGGSGGGGNRSSSAIGTVNLPGTLAQAEPAIGPVQPEQTWFSDLAAVEWARESVERLYAVGAISAAEQFRPNDSVTREEFVKLMAVTLRLAKTSQTADFTDVAADAWYAPYIAAAQAMGIVTGHEDGRFGVGEQMTRQDMAVMLCRALEALAVQLPDENAGLFTDDSEISGYARSAVYAMRNAGVINGLGNGCFGPEQNASRAQSAKLLCGMLDLLEKQTGGRR